MCYEGKQRDAVPTVAAAGEPDLVEKVKKGFVYWNDDGQLCAVRVGPLKIHFLIQENTGMDFPKRNERSLIEEIWLGSKVDNQTLLQTKCRITSACT